LLLYHDFKSKPVVCYSDWFDSNFCEGVIYKNLH
jgi:hypothetical protein